MKMKVELVFIPAPAVGHLVSTLEFAKQLLDRDDDISISILSIKSAFPSSRSSDSYLESFAASQPRLKIIHVPQVPPLDDPQNLQSSPIKFFSLYIQSHTQKVKTILSDLLSSSGEKGSTKVSGLILDFFCVSMIDVAHELHLPSYLFMTSNAGFLALMLYLLTPQNQTTSDITFSDPDFQIPGIEIPIPPTVLPHGLLFGNYDAYIEIATKLRHASGILVNSCLELERHAFDSFKNSETKIPPVYAVGPVVDLEARQAQMNLNQVQRDEIIAWLDGQPQSSVVFLCFGSMGSFDEAQLREIALGLERSGRRFLWSMRDSPEKLPETTRSSGKGKICRWAPQAEVLAHKAIGGFVSHCGWNSVLESLWNGVPVVTWPLYAEQQLNAYRMVRELGMAVEMRLDYRKGGGGGVVVAEEIERAVKGVMSESEVRKKVEEMGEVSRRAVSEGGSSFVEIGRFISLVTSYCDLD